VQVGMPRIGTLKARQIKAARALLDWSQEKLAEAAGLSVAMVRKLELGSILRAAKPTNISGMPLRKQGSNSSIRMACVSGRKASSMRHKNDRRASRHRL